MYCFTWINPLKSQLISLASHEVIWRWSLRVFLVYGCAVSKKLPTSFLICCSKAFCVGRCLICWQKEPYRFRSSFFHRQSQALCQRWSPPLARAHIGIFLAMNVQSSSISMKEQASVCGGLAGSAWAACTNQRETVLWWIPRFLQMALSPDTWGITFQTILWG